MTSLKWAVALDAYSRRIHTEFLGFRFDDRWGGSYKLLMKCPRCVQRIHRAAESCPHCGFSIVDADGQFGGDPWCLRRLTDAAGVLRRADREWIQSAMGHFSKRFPQLFVAVYTGSLEEVATMRPFGFWLLNRTNFDDLPAEMGNEAGILLTIDPETKSAGLVYGYLVEPYLNEADTFECLIRAHGHWLEGRYADGIIRVLAHLETILIKRSGQARRNIEGFKRKVMRSAMLAENARQKREIHTQGDVLKKEVKP